MSQENLTALINDDSAARGGHSRTMSCVKLIAASALLFFVSQSAQAVDAFEYQVYDAGLNPVGEYSLEVHLNSNIRGKSPPDYPEQLNKDGLTHLTFEFVRGMTPWWELGAYLQTALGQDGIYRYAGSKLRAKFARPKQPAQMVQLGVNFEISNIPKAFEEHAWGAEVRPIVGVELDRLTVLFNPILAMNLTSGYSSTPSFAPALKASFDTLKGFALGAEYYADFDEVNKLSVLAQAEQYLFIAYDLLGSKYELNVALGKGITDASNPLVAKAIFGFAF